MVDTINRRSRVRLTGALWRDESLIRIEQRRLFALLVGRDDLAAGHAPDVAVVDEIALGPFLLAILEHGGEPFGDVLVRVETFLQQLDAAEVRVQLDGA